jgi:ribosomal protein L27
MLKSTTVFFFLLISIISISQDASVFKPDAIKKEMTAVQITGSIKIDGLLNEEEWKLAKPSPRFVQIEPQQGMAPNFETDVKILYNRQYLYVAFVCHDSLGKKAIRATDFRRDFGIRSHDHVALSFDGFNDTRNAMALMANAYGVQRDLLVFDDILTDVDWDGLWKVRTTRTDSGWTAEIAIPWQTLRYPKTKDSVQQWGFNVYRTRRMSNEISAFSTYPRNFSFTRMAYAGILKGLQPPPPKPNIRLQPYILGSYDRYKNFPAATDPEKNNFRAGGDVKWAINPNTILDLTVNTDFAQADADRQVNNVTRFSVFFPERRQFFLENASLFGVGVRPSEDQSGGTMRIQPFFSRRIGLDDFGNPIPLDAGGRFVYRSSKRNAGIIAMRQRGSSTTPGTNFFVGRFSENFGKQNRIGGLMTYKNNADVNNTVGAIDGFFRMGESHSLNTMLIYSKTSTKNSTVANNDGFAGYAQYYYTNNQWKLWWTQSAVTKNFDPALGFVSRSDVIGTTPGIFWYYRGKALPFKKWIRAFEPGVFPEFYHQASTGKLIERQLTMNPIWINFQSGGYFGYIITPTYQLLTEPFAPLGINIPAGKYNYLRHQFYFSSDQSRIASANFNFETGSYFNGDLFAGTFSLNLAPSPHFYLQGQFNRNHFKEVGDPAINRTVDLYSISGRLALNPRLQLIGFYQKNSENNLSNYNIRLSWEYQPLSYVYLVFNRRGFDNTQMKRQTEDHAIIKISYLRQL